MIIKMKDLIKEELYNSQGEGYTFGKGDIVKDINPDCPHHGAEGEVIKGGKVKITFRVTNNGANYKEGDELEKTTDQMVKLNSDEITEGQLNEKKKIDQKYLDKLHLLTQNNNHTEARIYLSMMLQNKKLRKFYTAMMELRDVFGGYGPELSKLNQKMEKELYKQIKKKYANSAEVIGLL